jgi:hypothetical protein
MPLLARLYPAALDVAPNFLYFFSFLSPLYTLNAEKMVFTHALTGKPTCRYPSPPSIVSAGAISFFRIAIASFPPRPSEVLSSSQY